MTLHTTDMKERLRSAREYTEGIRKRALRDASTADLRAELIRRDAHKFGEDVAQFVEHVAFCADVTLARLLSPSKPANIAGPRAAGMAILRLKFGMSLQDSSEAFGRKDHSTTIYSVNRIKRDAEFARLVEDVWKSWERKERNGNLD